MVTGEPVPVDADPGAQVIGGTISTTGRIVLVATAVGAHTVLAQMAAIADEAQQRKAQVRTLVDRVVTFFVPVVLVLAVLTFVGWILAGDEPRTAFGNAVAVLHHRLPVRSRVGNAHRPHGRRRARRPARILIKGQDALEASGAIDTVVLDKTGTLTTGEMAVTDVIPFGVSRRELLRYAGALESGRSMGSERPLRRSPALNSIRCRAVRDSAACPVWGATATLDGSILLIGNRRLLESEQIALPDDAGRSEDALARGGKTVVFMTVDGAVVGVLAVIDGIRPTAADTVKDLRAMKLRTIMLTGDSAEAAQRVADELGIDDVIARVLPLRRPRSSDACSPRVAESPSSVTVSMTPQHSRPRTSGWRW